MKFPLEGFDGQLEAAGQSECQESDHHYASIHQPGLPVYWVRQCTICGHFDAVDMVSELIAAGWRPA